MPAALTVAAVAGVGVLAGGGVGAGLLAGRALSRSAGVAHERGDVGERLAVQARTVALHGQCPVRDHAIDHRVRRVDVEHVDGVREFDAVLDERNPELGTARAGGHRVHPELVLTAGIHRATTIVVHTEPFFLDSHRGWFAWTLPTMLGNTLYIVSKMYKVSMICGFYPYFSTQTTPLTIWQKCGIV